MESKKTYRVEYDYHIAKYSDIFLLTDQEVMLVETRLAKAQESGDLAGWSVSPEEVGDYDDLLFSIEENDVPGEAEEVPTSEA
jgi:hypothetical protein